MLWEIPMPLQLAIVVIVMIILMIIYVRFDDPHKSTKSVRVQSTIQELYRKCNKVCQACNMHPMYTIVESQTITSSEKRNPYHNIGTIYLVLWNEHSNELYDDNTLMYSMLHEISHLLSPSVGHQPPFDNIEHTLLVAAERLGYYRSEIPVDARYRTIES